MSKETRQAHSAKLAVMASVQGHNSTVAHSFNHTDGACPKCGCKEHHMRFCVPYKRPLPAMPNCELDGEHLHRICGACLYPWVERCLDQAMLSEERGELVAESEMAAALAAIANRTGGLKVERGILASYRGWVIHFHRDQESGNLVITSSEPPPQKGDPVHLKPEDVIGARA